MTPGATSFLLLTLDAGTGADAMVSRLRNRLGDVEISTVETIKRNDVQLMVEVFAIPLRLMVGIAFAVGTAILGMIIYTATVERQREYGVLKAVGAENGQLYWLVTQQGLATGLMGVILGIGLAWLAAQWIMIGYPEFLIILRPESALSASLVGLLMGLLAALLPARQVARLDPARVFRS